MSDNSLKLEVQQLIFGPLNWEKVIAADLVKEIEKAVAEKTDTVPEMRRFLAIKGYRALNELLSKESEGKVGPEALKAMANSSRTFAKERPACPLQLLEILSMIAQNLLKLQPSTGAFT